MGYSSFLATPLRPWKLSIIELSPKRRSTLSTATGGKSFSTKGKYRIAPGICVPRRTRQATRATHVNGRPVTTAPNRTLVRRYRTAASKLIKKDKEHKKKTRPRRRAYSIRAHACVMAGRDVHLLRVCMEGKGWPYHHESRAAFQAVDNVCGHPDRVQHREEKQPNPAVDKATVVSVHRAPSTAFAPLSSPRWCAGVRRPAADTRHTYVRRRQPCRFGDTLLKNGGIRAQERTDRASHCDGATWRAPSNMPVFIAQGQT